MRKVWKEKFDEIEALLASYNDDGRVEKTPGEIYCDTREAVVLLTEHVKNLSILVDRFSGKVGGTWR